MAFLRPFRPLAPGVSIPRAAFFRPFRLRSSSYAGTSQAVEFFASALLDGNLRIPIRHLKQCHSRPILSPFLLGGIFRDWMSPEVLNLEEVRMGFGILGVVSAMGVHLLLFVAEGLRRQDAPKAVWALVLFWIGFIAFGLW